MDAFKTWASQNGIKAPNVAVQKTQWAGNGLVATRALDGIDPLVQIPHQMIITAAQVLARSQPLFTTTLQKCCLGSYSPISDEEFVLNAENEGLCLRLFLVFEKYVAPTSFWKPYIDILPTIESLKETHVLLMDDAKVLEGTQLADSVQSKRRVLEQELKKLQALDDGWLSTITLDQWLWANVVFWSRVVSLASSQDTLDHDGDLALIPFFDFSNHSPTPSIRWQLTPDGLDLVSFDNKPLEANQELCLSYGEKSNQELLFLHGFCLDDNKVPSQVKIPIMPFLDLSQGEESLDYHKVMWLRSRAIRPVLTLQTPEHIAPIVPKDVHQVVLETGLARDSLGVMYLVVCDEDDLVEFKSNDQLSLKALSLEPKSPTDVLDSQLDTLEDVMDAVTGHPRLQVIQLRVVMLLLDALTHYLDGIKSAPKHPECLISNHVEKYRLEEEACLEYSMEKLIELRDQLMGHPTVVAYLSE
ncbi:hypothetical protein CLU79DRAFT_721198 [Phycomyces nitens]|nr:hypothetical protein CLU79DRAFT_721198 [Phycomyces nitens]